MARRNMMVICGVLLFGILIIVEIPNLVFASATKKIIPLNNLTTQETTPTVNNVPTTVSDTPQPEIDHGGQSSKNSLVFMTQLLEQFSKANLKPGWIHLSDEYSNDSDTGDGVLPNGVPIPDKYMDEYYLHIGEDGLVFEGVSYMKSMDGIPIQTVVYKDNRFVTQEFENVTESVPYAPSLDFGVLADFKRLEKSGITITNDVASLDGQPVTIYTAKDELSEPTVMDAYKLRVTAIEKKVYIDGVGKLVQFDVIYYFEDKTSRLAGHSTNFKVEIGIEPPPDVVDLLNK